jgi:hypothetical protein
MILPKVLEPNPYKESNKGKNEKDCNVKENCIKTEADACILIEAGFEFVCRAIWFAQGRKLCLRIG